MSIFRPYPFRKNHWSSSKLAAWLRIFLTDGNIIKPEAATMEEWSEWKINYKTNYPRTYYFLENIIDDIQDIIYYPRDVFLEVKHYCINRFIRKTHIVSTGVKKGDYRDHDTRMLNAIMNILVDFVENDTGIEHLTWSSSLVYDETWGVSKEDPKYNTYCDQALAAQTFLEVYNWWKNIRPARKDPYEEEYTDFMQYAKIEHQYDEEDNLMIEKLLKYRSRLWS